MRCRLVFIYAGKDKGVVVRRQQRVLLLRVGNCVQPGALQGAVEHAEGVIVLQDPSQLAFGLNGRVVLPFNAACAEQEAKQ